MLWVQSLPAALLARGPRLEIPVFTASHTRTTQTVGSAEQGKKQGTDPAYILP